jgi:hypothetical protein
MPITESSLEQVTQCLLLQGANLFFCSDLENGIQGVAVKSERLPMILEQMRLTGT